MKKFRYIREAKDYSKFERHLVTFESVPSVDGGLIPEIHKSGLDAKLMFNELSLGLITDEVGRDLIGHTINSDYEQSRATHFGTFEGNHSPTNIFQMAESFHNESLAKPSEMDMYCAVIGIAFEQDAVPYMRAEKFQAAGDNLHFGLQLDFEHNLDKDRFEQLADLFQKNAEGVEFTVVGDKALRAVNFRDDNGIPFAMSDQEFIGKVIKVAEQFPSDESVSVVRMRISGNYIFNDWNEHPNGDGYKSILRENGREDLIALADDLRGKFLEKVKIFSQEMEIPEKTVRRQTMDDLQLGM